MDTLIWFDGELVPAAEAKVSVLTHALHYGTSVFEGVRAYATGRGVAVFRLHEHSVRLLESEGVMFTPGSALDMEGYVRIGYANNHAVLEEGLPRVSRFLRTLNSGRAKVD